VFSPWHPTTVPAQLRPLLRQYGGTVPQVALSWLLHRSPVMLPIPGTSSVAHLDENLAAVPLSLTPDEVEAITKLVPE
jgi:aryl-alcohol dehydrogenase-like predicted oxidoreductase